MVICLPYLLYEKLNTYITDEVLMFVTVKKMCSEIKQF